MTNVLNIILTGIKFVDTISTGKKMKLVNIYNL